MNKLYSDIDKIDLFRKGELAEKEEGEVRTRLMEDEDFRDLFGDMEVMTEGIKRSADKSTKDDKLRKLKKAIEAEEEEEEEEDLSDKKILIIWYNRPLFRAIAAAILILLVTIPILRSFDSPTGPELFAEYFEPFDNLMGPTRGENVEGQRMAANAAYDRQDWQQAAILFEGLVRDESDYDQKLIYKFYLGNVYLGLEDADKAIEELTVVQEEGTGMAPIQSKWYLALAYLLKDDVDQAKELIRQFREEEGSNYDRAEDILEKLN